MRSWVPLPRRWQLRQWLCSLNRCNASALWNMGSWINPTVSLILPLPHRVCSLLFSLPPTSECVHEKSQRQHERQNMYNYGERVNRLSPVSHVRHLMLQVHEMRPTLRDFYTLWSGVWEEVSPIIAKLWIQDWKCDPCGNFFPLVNAANSWLVNSSLPAVCSHWHWLHVYLNEAPQWLWKHTVMVGYTLSTDQLYCVKHHSLVMMLNHRCCLSYCTVTLWEHYCGCFHKPICE